MNTPVPARWQVVRAGLITAHLTRAGGGVFTSMRQFARVLETQPDIQVDVFGPARSRTLFPEWSPITPRTASSFGPASFSFAPGLAGRVHSSDLDLLHLHGLWTYPSMVSLGFTRRTARPHIISPHGMLDPWALQNSVWKKRLAARLFEDANIQTASCLHALNSSEEAAIRAYGFTGPVCVIPNGVDLPPPDRAPAPPPWWTKREPELKNLLYLGRLHPKKGLPNLMKAWSQLDRETYKQWRLAIAGWDDHGHQLILRRIATALRIEASVTLTGPLFGEDKRAALEHCHAFILPSLSEGQPMAVLEAWACGKPVLMTPQCNIPEGFEAGAAVRIEPEVESLLAGLTAFFAMQDEERESVGAKGRALVTERFAWPVIAGQMAGVYQWLTRNGQKPATITP
jgi:glycosyltransferase involved in cell wall biosynthesis